MITKSFPFFLQILKVCLAQHLIGKILSIDFYPKLFLLSIRIGLIDDRVDSRYVGFQIVMQISHALCWGANIGKKANCGTSARNIEITLLKVYFRI